MIRKDLRAEPSEASLETRPKVPSAERMGEDER
jgi:hypothetical protein